MKIRINLRLLARRRMTVFPRRQTLSNPPRRQAGFTLLELLVVLAILGLLAALVGPRVMGYLGSSKTQTASIQLGNIEASLDLFRIDTGKYPQKLDDLMTKPASASNWNGPYFKKPSALMDPWGEPYQYKSPGDHGEYDLYSFGADKAEGGTDEDADVRSW